MKTGDLHAHQLDSKREVYVMAKLQRNGTVKYASPQEAYDTYNFHKLDQVKKLEGALRKKPSARSRIISLSGPEGIGKEYLLRATAHNLTNSGQPTAVAALDLQDWKGDNAAGQRDYL